MSQRAVHPVLSPMDDLSVGIEFDQFLSHFFDALFDTGCGASPTGTAQPVHPEGLALRSPIALNLIQPVERHVELVAAGELQDQVITLEPLDRQPAEALV